MATNFNSFNSFYPMNKIYKYILGIIPLTIGISFCNAGLVESISNDGYFDVYGNNNTYSYTVNSGVECFISPSGLSFSDDNGATYTGMNAWYTYCFTGNVIFKNGGGSSQRVRIYKTLYREQIQCETCEEQYTSLECQTEYNLIPIEDITANYCHINFGLIDPASCPISEGSGTNWSSLYINETQYASNDSVRLGIPEFIAWNLTYNTGETIVEIEGYNADTEYMDNIIAQTEIAPTAEDMSTLVNGLQAYLPYFFIGLICVFFIGLVKKFFRG